MYHQLITSAQAALQGQIRTQNFAPSVWEAGKLLEERAPNAKQVQKNCTMAMEEPSGTVGMQTRGLIYKHCVWTKEAMHLLLRKAWNL